MTDNSAALRRARRQDSTDKRHRAAETIDAFERSGEAINFPVIARSAGVSVSLLYSDRDLAGRIAAAREKQRQAGNRRAWTLPTRSLITEQSLHTELANSKEQARQLAEEVTVLHERLARELGADADAARGHAIRPMLDQLEDRAAQLEADNHALRQRVLALEHERDELTDTLEAARTMNRELMAQINRDVTAAADGQSSGVPPAGQNDHDEQPLSATSSTDSYPPPPAHTRGTTKERQRSSTGSCTTATSCPSTAPPTDSKTASASSPEVKPCHDHHAETDTSGRTWTDI